MDWWRYEGTRLRNMEWKHMVQKTIPGYIKEVICRQYLQTTRLDEPYTHFQLGFIIGKRKQS